MCVCVYIYIRENSVLYSGGYSIYGQQQLPYKRRHYCVGRIICVFQRNSHGCSAQHPCLWGGPNPSSLGNQCRADPPTNSACCCTRPSSSPLEHRRSRGTSRDNNVHQSDFNVGPIAVQSNVPEVVVPDLTVGYNTQLRHQLGILKIRVSS